MGTILAGVLGVGSLLGVAALIIWAYGRASAKKGQLQERVDQLSNSKDESRKAQNAENRVESASSDKRGKLRDKWTVD